MSVFLFFFVWNLKMINYIPTGTNICAKNNGGCEQLCLPSGGSRVCECTVGYQKDGSGEGVKCKGE